MPVTITLGHLANQVSLSVTISTTDIPIYYVAGLTSDLAAATALVETRAPLAPDEQQNRAVVQIVAYWQGAPDAAPQRFGYNAWQNSGAAQLLAPFIDRRAEAV